MPDSRDLDPPPSEPMPDDVRARITQRLHAGVHEQSAQTWRRPGWLAPALAAAAVLAVVGGAFVATTVDDGGAGGSGTSLQPADGDGNGAPAPVTPTSGEGALETPQPEGTARPTAEALTTAPEATVVEATPGDPGSAIATGACEDEIATLGEPGLNGAVVTAERAYGPGTTYLYETKSAWVVCDDLAASDGGAATLLSPHDKAQPYVADVTTLAVSDNLITRPNGSWAYAEFVAAGRDFNGVQAISYAFPDGHTEAAVVGVNGLWSMTYLATDGPFLDHEVNTSTLDPIEVTVRFTGGDTQTYTLAWGDDTCAQINHGC